MNYKCFGWKALDIVLGVQHEGWNLVPVTYLRRHGVSTTSVKCLDFAHQQVLWTMFLSNIEERFGLELRYLSALSFY
jgi:hypothetical protein